MHDHHKGHAHSHHHDHPQAPETTEALRRLQAMLEHWIEHNDSHNESFREWAKKAGEAGEEEVAREIHLAIGDADSITDHLKRARAIVSAKLVLRK